MGSGRARHWRRDTRRTTCRRGRHDMPQHGYRLYGHIHNVESIEGWYGWASGLSIKVSDKGNQHLGIPVHPL